jgi:hypothetical protein
MVHTHFLTSELLDRVVAVTIISGCRETPPSKLWWFDFSFGRLGVVEETWTIFLPFYVFLSGIFYFSPFFLRNGFIVA